MPTRVWPTQMVIAPRSGQPIVFCSETMKSNNDKPMMISGITSGAVIMPLNNGRPKNFL